MLPCVSGLQVGRLWGGPCSPGNLTWRTAAKGFTFRLWALQEARAAAEADLARAKEELSMMREQQVLDFERIGSLAEENASLTVGHYKPINSYMCNHVPQCVPFRGLPSC